MSKLKLLASRNFITVNKTLMLELGIDEAIMIGELASEYDYWESTEQLDSDGFFYATVEKIEENTTLTKYKQKKALDNLQKLGIVEVKRKGVPAKRYIKINEEELMKILSNKKSKNLTSGSQKISQLEVKKFDLNNNINNNNKNNKKVSKKEKSPERNNEPTTEQKTETYDEIIEDYTDSPELQQTLKEYIKMRAMKKAPLTNGGLKLILQELKTFSPSTLYQIGVLQKAIMNGSSRLYELTENEATRIWEKYHREMDKFFD